MVTNKIDNPSDIDDQEYKLILMDCLMPDMDGA